MTLRLEQVAAQLPGLVERYREQLDAMEAGLRAARLTLGHWSDDPEAGNRRVEEAMERSPLPYALASDEAPAAAFDALPFVSGSVVAADGSSIEPDRFAAVQCYVVNVGSVVLPYGVGGEPVLESRAHLGPEAFFDEEGEDHGSDEIGPAGWAVNLRRDVRELEACAELAAERAARGPVVALVDGTLFPWDLDSPNVPAAVRQELKRRTQDALDLVAVAGEPISLGAYVSGSRSRDVVTSLQALATGPQATWPQADGQLFRGLLGDGQRSAVFRACSQRLRRVEELFSPAHQVRFFYLRVGDDLARVEVPHWAATAARIARLHAALVDQCSRAGGYPRALQEAHELAVISSADRLQFSNLLDREAWRQGLRAPANGKQTSKRRRAV